MSGCCRAPRAPGMGAVVTLPDMTPRLLPKVVALALLLATASVACDDLTGRCNFTITGVPPAGAVPVVGARLPDNATIIITEADIDWNRSIMGRDEIGQPSVTLQLRADAAPAFARYTAMHVGEMLAIAVDDTILAVPTIAAQIEAELTVSGPPDLVDLEPLGACVADG